MTGRLMFLPFGSAPDNDNSNDVDWKVVLEGGLSENLIQNPKLEIYSTTSMFHMFHSWALSVQTNPKSFGFLFQLKLKIKPTNLQGSFLIAYIGLFLD